MRDHISFLKSEVSRLYAKGTAMEKPLEVTIIMCSLSNLSSFQEITTPINTPPENTTLRDNMNTLLVGEDKRVTWQKASNSKEILQVVGAIAPSPSEVS